MSLVFLILIMGVWQILPKKSVRKDTGKISVVTSFYPLYFMAGEIGKERVDVKNMTPVGVEPHDYEPTARDIMDIENSRLVILNGRSFESWGEKVKTDLKESGVVVTEAGEGLFSEEDSHVWLSPDLAKRQATAVLAGLIRVDPDNAEFYTENSRVLNEKLTMLQGDYLSGLSQCQRKDFVTSHDAFGYLAKEFDLNQVAIAGLSPDEEPSTKQLVEITKLAEEKNLKYIFFETLVSPKLSETVAQEIGAKTLVLDPIEGISDNDTNLGKDYLSLMRENLTNLRIALECK
jgi:zinc transport system substrate-binding protein